MTDRLASCKDSPDGKHQYVYTLKPYALICKFCERKPLQASTR